jgi:uncharacterized protein
LTAPVSPYPPVSSGTFYVLARIVLGLVLLGGILLILSPKLAEALLYQPSRGDPGPPPVLLGVPGEVVTLTTEDGVPISAWWYEAGRRDGGSPPMILFLHGNAGDISHRTPIAEGLLREGLSVLLLEYRGYGSSGGKPSEGGFHLDARAGRDFLLGKGGGSARIVVMGRSMGGAVAVSLAAREPVGGLVLESAFTSLAAMAGTIYPFLPSVLFRRLRGRFATVELVRDVDVPVLVIHGEADDLVPLEMGRELLEAAREPKEWMGVPGAGHNDVFWVAGDSYFRRIAAFARECCGP